MPSNLLFDREGAPNPLGMLFFVVALCLSCMFLVGCSDRQAQILGFEDEDDQLPPIINNTGDGTVISGNGNSFGDTTTEATPLATPTPTATPAP